MQINNFTFNTGKEALLLWLVFLKLNTRFSYVFLTIFKISQLILILLAKNMCRSMVSEVMLILSSCLWENNVDIHYLCIWQVNWGEGELGMWATKFSFWRYGCHLLSWQVLYTTFFFFPFCSWCGWSSWLLRFEATPNLWNCLNCINLLYTTHPFAVTRASPSRVSWIDEPSHVLTELGPGFLLCLPCRKAQDTSSPPQFWWMPLRSYENTIWKPN